MISSNEILKIYGTDYKEMTIRLLEASDLKALIGNRGIRIGIKPNLVCPSPADFGATTHPEIVAGIIEYLRGCGYNNLCIVEGSWVGDKTADAFEYCGYRALTEEYGVPFIDAQQLPSHEADCAGMKLCVTDIVKDLDFLINVPVLKGHCQTKVTCALKNMKGLLPNTEKRHFHRMGLHKPIAHLSTYIHQDFIVVDHICGDPDFEEGGHPVVRNCIMTALDPVLVDSYACSLLSVAVSDVPYIPLAASLGTGSTDLTAAKILRLAENAGTDTFNESADAPADNDAPAHSDIPAAGVSALEGGRKFVFTPDHEAAAAHELLDVSYAVDDADSCSACYGSLVPALYRLEEEGLLADLHEKIGIGQGHQKDTGGLGVGRCTAKYDHCIMGCPPDEEKIYEELKEYIRAHRSQTNS